MIESAIGRKKSSPRGENLGPVPVLRDDRSPRECDVQKSSLQVRVVKKNRWGFPVGSLVWLSGLAPHCMGKTVKDIRGTIAYPVFSSDADIFGVV